MRIILAAAFFLMTLAACGPAKPVRSGADQDVVVVIVNTVVESADKLPKRTVAVLNFTDIDGQETEEGKVLAEQLVTKLAANPDVKVVERTRLNQLLDEQKLSLTGISESEDQTVGQIVNADAVVSGTIVDQGDFQEINSRMVGVKTGEVLAAANARRSQKLRMQELNALPEEARTRIQVEDRNRQELQKKNPELYRIVTGIKREMLSLRSADPDAFLKASRVIRTEEQLKRNRPRILFLLTEPRDSKALQQLKSGNTAEFERANRFRRGLAETMELVPSFKDKVVYDRKELIRKGFK